MAAPPRTPGAAPLSARWLARVAYDEAADLQDQLFREHTRDYLLLLEHPHSFTCGRNTKPGNLLWDETERAARRVTVAHADRGGDVTYHGPGQLVAYPIIRLPDPDVIAYLRGLEEVLIRTAADFGVASDRFPPYTGIWVGDRKLAAIGVKAREGVTKHGVALNVDPDLDYFGGIVPCGISDYGVTSLAREMPGGAPPPSVRAAGERFAARFAEVFGFAVDLSSEEPWSRVAAGLRADRKPDWLKVRIQRTPAQAELRSLLRDLDLHTVCESAGCPNLSECWSERTATVMILGDQCTRACGFCRVETGKPGCVDEDEPRRVAQAIAAMGLAHAVVTSVARDDLPDGGASVFAATIRAIHEQVPDCAAEVLVPDFQGSAAALETVIAAGPEVLNHNLETVIRLQKPVRKSHASYARSLTVLARAHRAGLTTKSGIIVGLGESSNEVRAAVEDLRAAGVDILTVGQYLQPTARHIQVERYWSPEEFAELASYARSLGFAHVEAGPLVRSSYHARSAASAAADDG